MPKKQDDFYTFEEALAKLEIAADELKQMVSEGTLMAFKEGDRMKFKKEDIENIKKGSITEPTVILPPGEMDIPVSADDQTFIEEETTSNIGITEEIPIVDSDITVPALDEDTGLKEELIESAEPAAEPVADEIKDTVAEEFVDTVAEAPGEKPKGKTGTGMRRFQPAAEAAPFELLPGVLPPRKYRTPPIFIAFLGATFLFLVFAGAFLNDVIRITTGKGKYPLGLSRELGSVIISLFIDKSEVDIDKYKNIE
ncbi:MAG: helix-turn-helix domain-containing protein [Planctomycetes bacterium]|nr:helix-turn-helix domain-containing protein [Planctomycetota bacterium]